MAKPTATSDRALLALTVLRLCLGVFFVAEAFDKIGWLADPSLLAKRFDGYLKEPHPISRWYIETFAKPHVDVFARMVFFGELSCGVALLTGVLPRLAAALAFVMVLNFHVASGALFEFQFLRNGYGLPVLGGLLALAIGARRTPLRLHLGKDR